jgi:hypothetical protein
MLAVVSMYIFTPQFPACFSLDCGKAWVDGLLASGGVASGSSSERARGVAA